MAGNTAYVPVKKLGDVFSVTNGCPDSYIERCGIDDAFRDGLNNGRSAVIYGDSRRGKSCLISFHISKADRICVFCNSRMSMAELYGSILQKAGYEPKSGSSVTTENRTNYKGTAGVSSNLFDLKVEGGGEKGEKITRDYSALDLNQSDPNYVISALNSMAFQKYIVLEDFHLLASSVQTTFAAELKSFIQSGIRFLISGISVPTFPHVFRVKPLLQLVTFINVSPWEESELRGVMDLGAAKLNVTFDENFKNSLLANCFGDVSIIQAACCEVCRQQGIHETKSNPVCIGANLDVKEIIRHILDPESSPYPVYIKEFAKGFRRTTKELPKWIMYAVLTAAPDELIAGMKSEKIKSRIEQNENTKIRSSWVIHDFLRRIDKLQKEHCGNRIVLQYNEATRILSVMDRDFIIWLNVQDRDALLSSIGIPTG